MAIGKQLKYPVIQSVDNKQICVISNDDYKRRTGWQKQCYTMSIFNNVNTHKTNISSNVQLENDFILDV